MNKLTLNRARGCLMGQIAGDSLGSLVEFQTPDVIMKAYPDGVRDLADARSRNLIAGQPTDDSEMALSLARMLVEEGRYDSGKARNAYVFWVNSKPHTMGMATFRGLQGRPIRDSQANGAMMRISPLGIFGARHDLKQVAKWARQDAAITHTHPVCRQANALFTMAIAHAIQSECDAPGLYNEIVNWAEGMKAEDMKAEDMRTEHGTPQFRNPNYGDAEYEKAHEVLLELIAGAAESPPAEYFANAGWVLIAFRNALWQLLHASNLEEAVVDTVGRGGDTDTNAAICGALFGAVSGLNAIPVRWKDTVLNCRPEGGKPNVYSPRPKRFWPTDALELAERLIG